MKPHRRTRPGPASQADDWLMTYADVITLLFCVMVVFASLVPAASQKSAPPQARPPAAAPAAPPVVFGDAGPFHSLADAEDPAEDDTDDAQAGTAPVDPAPVFPLRPGDDVALTPPPGRGIAGSGAAAATAGAERRAMSVRLAGEALQPGGPIDRTPGGDRITTIEIRSAALFDSGSANLREVRQEVPAVRGDAARVRPVQGVPDHHRGPYR